jgi:hypothetical protein
MAFGQDGAYLPKSPKLLLDLDAGILKDSRQSAVLLAERDTIVFHIREYSIELDELLPVQVVNKPDLLVSHKPILLLAELIELLTHLSVGLLHLAVHSLLDLCDAGGCLAGCVEGFWVFF